MRKALAGLNADRGDRLYLSANEPQIGTGTSAITESQKIGNDSPGFPHVCIQLRAQFRGRTGNPGADAGGERRNPFWQLAGNHRD